MGWRGFATTQLQERHSGAATAVIVGLLWGLWHIPLFVWPDSPMSKFPFWPWFAALLGESVILGWLFNRTNQSLAIAVVFHVLFNVFGAVIGIQAHAALAIVNLS